MKSRWSKENDRVTINWRTRQGVTKVGAAQCFLTRNRDSWKRKRGERVRDRRHCRGTYITFLFFFLTPVNFIILTLVLGNRVPCIEKYLYIFVKWPVHTRLSLVCCWFADTLRIFLFSFFLYFFFFILLDLLRIFFFFLSRLSGTTLLPFS